jgi:hypothetical protein
VWFLSNLSTNVANLLLMIEKAKQKIFQEKIDKKTKRNFRTSATLHRWIHGEVTTTSEQRQKKKKKKKKNHVALFWSTIRFDKSLDSVDGGDQRER